MTTASPRIVILTADSIYSRAFVKAFQGCTHAEIVGTVLSTAYLKRGVGGLTGVYLFIRSVGVSYAIYQALVCWLLPWIRGKAPYKVPIWSTNDVNSSESVAWLRALAPDFLLSFHFNQKILDSVIGVPKQATLNFHPSYLPTWRGVDPVLFALQEESSVLGGSLHWVASEIDAGDVLLREKLGNEFVDGLIRTNAHLFTLGGRMAAEVIRDFKSFDAQRIHQADLGAGRYDGWCAVGKLGLKGLWKALWANRRKTL